MRERGVSRRGQVTVFIILAIIIIAAVALFFIFKDDLLPNSSSKNFHPIETDFLSCFEDKVVFGIKVLESQGGYIEMPPFIKGSEYMPFSSQLDFLGVDVPYWYFISGNNLAYENVPTKEKMQEELQNYLNLAVKKCGFANYFEQGYSIETGEANSEVIIGDDYVRVNLQMDLSAKNSQESIFIKEHEVEINTNLGNLYDDAIQFYEKEKNEMFLENYSVDILRNYAPVDGFELTCSPKTWNANDIFSKLDEARQANFNAVKNKGSEEDYFALNLDIESDLRVISSINFPRAYEVNPADSPILVAKPVGTQEGLGILGFCYVPYHFVYDLRYPVLIQIYRGDEIFQFPISIIIDDNVPRESKATINLFSPSIDVCKDKLTEFSVSVFDSNLEFIDANVSYECLYDKCDIGETINGGLKKMFPACGNGNLVVEKEGYETFSARLSTVSSGSTTVILDKEYEKEVSLILDGQKSDKKAIITFESDNGVQSILYPQNKKIILSKGVYDLQVYVYDDSSIKFPATTKEECFDVPTSGIMGFFGSTTKQCNKIEVPEQEISSVLIGGGSGVRQITEEELKRGNEVRVLSDLISVPKTIEELQVNYLLLDAKKVGVEF